MGLTSKDAFWQITSRAGVENSLVRYFRLLEAPTIISITAVFNQTSGLSTPAICSFSNQRNGYGKPVSQTKGQLHPLSSILQCLRYRHILPRILKVIYSPPDLLPLMILSSMNVSSSTLKLFKLAAIIE